MDINHKNICIEPRFIKKSVDQQEYLAVEKVYMVNQNLNDTQDQYRTSSGLSMFFDVSYVELTPHKKTLSVILEQRKSLPESKASSLKEKFSEQGNYAKQQIIEMIERYRKINEENRAKGISVKKRVAKFCSQADIKIKVQKICEQLDGQSFIIFRLGVDEVKDSTVVKQYVISNAFYEMCGRNIVEEAIKLSQTKVLEEFHSKYNYKKQIFCILEWCLKRVEQYSRGEEIEQKDTFIFQLDKQLILPDGRIVKTKMNIYTVNPMIYYVIEKYRDTNPTAYSQFISVDVPSMNSTGYPKSVEVASSKESEMLGMFDKEQYVAGYREIKDKNNKVEIITRTHKN